MKRRQFLMMMGGAAFLMSVSAGGFAMGLFTKDKKNKTDFPFQMSEKEWRKRLNDQEYHVLREAGTERAFTSPLNTEKRNGSFLCAGCGHFLFSSKHKFDSGTGWPSFWKPAEEGSVELSTDYKLLYPRTEVHCANCGGHLGHVFKDGPAPTGLRYCINGVALRFERA